MDFSGLTVLCVGDLMLDRYHYGSMERISPEAPVPVLRLDRTREMPGGVGNVAANILSLGGRAVLVGLLSEDEAGRSLRGLLGAMPGLVDATVVSAERPTICKTRFVAANQQVVRADAESRAPLGEAEEAAILRAIEAEAGGCAVMLLSDYGKGVLSELVLGRAVARARALGIAVFVDPKSRSFARYRGASCITPNARELAEATGMPVDTDAEVERAARRALVAAEADAVLVTRSEKGMLLVERDGSAHRVGSRAREVFDVSGAGDTVIAALALAHAAGRTLEQGMHIANAAAGVVVGKLGTATAAIGEVVAELDLHEREQDGTGHENGLLPRHRALELVARWKAQGLSVGFTNGCFDILHPGHVAILRAARAACDRLVVGMNADASVARLKGPARPVNGVGARAQVLAALRAVDAVVSFEEDTPLALITALMPDVLVKGADYAPEAVVGREEVERNGGRLLLVPL
ncbi:MAG: D-glycero-beta-D-manno-heptose-7-phosphate kinase, partial [Gluconacetobacter diazotrophicus]|nr:D-glycero-beta-D-manno-heptose-7-phosphate kinase [Gluconacetobacter diazotrophicus]